ncbi:MAG: tRNA (N(6)-L-threonylcarbamoyladenosine(37)-C(2))-methylthiotransferase MtaB [Chloroflexi bacterium]|nr:tRNA (N(6)-L-threonylcarbamoyladenosine(37)-C(2))-methylthiotransferase MtaB [Chloroflexota bacterium]
MKVYLATLGCKLNEGELEAWSRQLAGGGHEIVSEPQQADLCVLNTCTVTHVAARKSRQLARQLARSNPNARLVLTGCYASVAPDEAKNLPNVALVVANADKDRLVALAGELLGDARFQTTETGCRLPEAVSGELQSTVNSEQLTANIEQLTVNSIQSYIQHPTSNIQHPTSNLQLPTSRTRAFVKVMDGCNMSCTYCIIPLARGRERSRPLSEVVDEIKSLVDAGYQEIILTGVQISVYRDSRTNCSPPFHSGDLRQFVLRDLVAAILGETNVPRLRLTSIAPWDLDESLLDLWSDARLCRHLHLSLQSGADTVLRRMRRAYSTEQFARVANLARERIPDVGVTTDVIVGFPGESDVEFEQSLRFVEQMQFSRVHVFPYSAREGTVAARLPLHVSEPVKQARAKQMQQVADASARAFAERFIGREMNVLWETQERESGREGERENSALPLWYGYTDNYIRVIAESEAALHNQITSARISRLSNDGVLGELSNLQSPISNLHSPISNP